MLELLALAALNRRIGAIIEGKGHKSGRYKFLTVVLWIGGEILGAFLGAFMSGGESGVTYFLALVGAAIGAAIAYSIANNVLPASASIDSLASSSEPATVGNSSSD